MSVPDPLFQKTAQAFEVLERECRMRSRVFADRPRDLQRKTEEIVRVQETLCDLLREAGGTEQDISRLISEARAPYQVHPQQPDLFSLRYDL